MKPWPALLSFLAVSVLFGGCEAARILGAFHFNGRSHFIMFEALLKGLAARGHQVYVVGHLPQKKPIQNYTDISLAGSLPSAINSFTINFARELGHTINVLNFIWNTNLDMCRVVLEHQKVQDLIKNNDTFDLIITEIFGPDCMNALSHRFKAPIIGMISSVTLPWANDRIGNPDHPAYIPSYFLPYSDHMTFGQRFINTILTELFKLGHYYFADLPMDKLSRQHFGPDVPPIAELQKMSLILVNSHFSLNFPRPTVPSLIEVGGLHIQEGGKLPEDLETFINGAKDGVIYFSLGSLVRPETLPKEKLDALLSLFSEIPQRVIWKIDTTMKMPDNVMADKWYPQFEILSHPNVRVFISHGGLMGIQEAVHAGVPIVGIPLFADQENNILNCALKGTAVMVPYEDISKESLSSALNTVLHDPSYRHKAQQLSRLFRDRPHTPLETAIFWTEYVIRHGGAPHLRSAALDLTWYQYLLLDVIAVIVLCTALLLGAVYVIFKRLTTIYTASISKKLKSN